MNLSIQGHNIDVTDAIENYVNKKVGRLDRYLPNLQEARVDLREVNSRNADQRFVAQVTLHDTHGTTIRAEERAPEIFPAIDTVVDKLHRQITRFKGKRKDRYQRHPTSEPWDMDTGLDFEPEESEEEASHIARVKHFPMSPMTPEEAIEQMELLGHTFFVFYHGDEGSVQVVYRRRDGNYGHIIPELM